ncbi:MAG: NAD(+) synthase [Prevotellaceae bacterium]|jgi:NAD+ synthase (glutamine-hydrolysing)|nr:NAD(+) synthase [Prevotellaceae bacterium]
MQYNFIKTAAALPVVEVADCKTNCDRIFDLIQKAENQGVEVVCFPELCLTAYTCADLFHNSQLIQSAENELFNLLKKTIIFETIFIIGMPVEVGNQLFNCAIVCQKGKIAGIVPKTYRPNNNEFYEIRWFASALDSQTKEIDFCTQKVPFGKDILFYSNDYLENKDNFTFSIEICEDLWAVIPPSSYQALGGSHVIFNLSASNELAGKSDYRRQLVSQQSGRCVAGYVYVSAGFGESSTDLLFASSAIIAENGTVLAGSERFLLEPQLIISNIDIERLKNDRKKNDSFKCTSLSENFRKIPLDMPVFGNTQLTRKFDRFPFVPQGKDLDERCQEIFNIQANALAVRLFHTGIKSAVIGVSGGLDSTLALLVTVATFDRLKIPRKNIFGITMPGFGSTARTKNNSWNLMKSLEISAEEISIVKAVEQHFKDIKQNPDNHDTTYENCQARERTQILMDYANKVCGLVIGTGDMSELALGWTTYNGDHISMYGVNSGVPKTLVQYLVKWIAENKTSDKSAKILFDIINTPISPELLPTNENDEIVQKTEDIVGPYELHDFFLYYFLRFGFSPEKIMFLAENAFENYDNKTIKKWLRVFLKRFFANQFKRSCMPDGTKVGSVNLSPRGDWRMPSDASVKGWIDSWN